MAEVRVTIGYAWQRHVLLSGMLGRDTCYYQVCLAEACVTIRYAWQRHVLLSGILGRGTCYYQVYLAEAHVIIGREVPAKSIKSILK